MIEISEALRWLNQFDRSHLNGTNQGLFASARNRRTDNAAIQDIIRSALQQAGTSPQDGLDYSETLLNCAVIEFDRGFTEQARDHLATAVGRYVRGKDVHGAAVAAWMHGITELAMQNADGTYDSWRRSLRTVDRFRQTNRHIPSTRDWYTSVFVKMNQDLVTLPQEAFTWINQFSGSRLSSFNRDLVELIDKNIKNGNRDEADRLINVLKEKVNTSPDPLECAEIFAEAGLARFRMREWPLAIRDLKEALRRYPAESHQKESTRWMLGAVQLWSRRQRVEALSNWEKSIKGFMELARQADQNNRSSQKRWYRDRIVYMKGALKGKITEFSSGDAMDFNIPEEGPSRTEGPPSPRTSGDGLRYSDPYRYLCTLVGGDQAVANQLIKLERQKTPNASRNELIERAIQRLLDDRR